LKDNEVSRALRLLEMQRNSMLMYTSCGWFFTDISGIETVQVMKYAGRVRDLMADAGAKPPEERFLEVLAGAKSNIPDMGSGADIFRRFVPASRTTPRRVAAHVAIKGLAGQSEEQGRIGDYSFSRQDQRQERHGRLTMSIERLLLETPLGDKNCDYAVAAIHLGGLDFYCTLQPYPGTAKFRAASELLWRQLATAFLPALLRAMEDNFGPDEFGLGDVLPDGRLEVCTMVFGDLLEGFTSQFARLYDEYNRVAEMLQEAGFPLPREVRQVAEFTLGHRFESEIIHQNNNTDPQAYLTALRIAERVARRGYRIDRTASNGKFTTLITTAVRLAVESPDPERLANARELVTLARRLGLEPNLDAAQEAVYAALTEKRQASASLEELAMLLGVSKSAIPPLTSISISADEKPVAALPP
jgi:hypothetical protein